MDTRWKTRRWPALAVLLACALALLATGAARADAAVSVGHLTVDRTDQPLGTEPASKPRFGWQLSSADRGVKQQTYRILVATRADLLRVGSADVWDSGAVTSDASVDVRFGGSALRARTRYWWAVRATTATADSGWSSPSWWETALRDGADAPGWSGIDQRSATGADQLLTRTLGQNFHADGTFTKASGMFVEYGTGNPSGLTLSLYSGSGPGGRLLASRSFSNVRTDVWLDVEAAAGTTFAAGDYYLVASDLRTSGDGMLGWWGHTDGTRYAGGSSWINGRAIATDYVFRVVPPSGDELSDFSADWITLPSDWATPISQMRATGAEQLTGTSLGQTFTADNPFSTAEGKFVEYGTGNPSTLTLSLYSGSGPGGRLLATRTFANVVTDRWLALDNGAGRTFPAGSYYLEASNLRTSGDGMLGWWGHVDSATYAGGGTYTDGRTSVGDRVFRITIPEEAPPTLRTQVTLGSDIVRARAYVSALGLYELHVNGRRIGSDMFAPGWTDYAKRVKYQTFDVTSAVQTGTNTLGAMIADGWYSGTVGGAGRYLYGPRPAFLLQLEVTYADGRTATVVTDTSWKGTRGGPVRAADIYQGESYDARNLLTGWSANGYDDSGWTRAVVPTGTGTDAPRVPQTHVPTTAHDPVAAVSVSSLGSGRYVFDLGREIGGVVRLEISGTAGQQVTLRHSPRLLSTGELDVGMLRSARATDVYTLKGGGTEVYQPHFTTHGFRYVEVSGLTTAPTTAMVSGVPLNADVASIGAFSTDSSLVNDLQRTLRATHLSHWLTMPIDTQERDERLGWVGEVSVSGGGLLFNYDVDNFIASWDDELGLAQRANGELPHVVPFVPLVGDGGAYATDAIVHSPYLLWQRYGETRVLERGYPAMVRWIERLRSQAGVSGLLGNASYADHLNLGQETPGGVIENASYVRALRELSQIATVLGKTADAADYARTAASVRTAYQSAYIAVDGRVDGDSQTGYAIAIAFDLMPTALRTVAGTRLAQRIADAGDHLLTGYSGTPHVMEALAQTGQDAVAERLILRTAYPSWGYMLSRGATTFWERWNSDTFVIDPNSGGNAGMNSFNHLPLATFGDWLYRDVGGLRNDPDGGEGYRKLIVDPQPGAVLKRATTSQETSYGRAEVAWREASGGDFSLAVTVPANTTATVHIPLTGGRAAFESGTAIARATGVTVVSTSASEAVVTVGSGSYAFTTR